MEYHHSYPQDKLINSSDNYHHGNGYTDHTFLYPDHTFLYPEGLRAQSKGKISDQHQQLSRCCSCQRRKEDGGSYHAHKVYS